MLQKALIIDDEKEICFLLSRILKTRGFDVSCAHNLSEAVEQMKTFTPSIIFLDNHLPDGLGVEFASFLKSKYPAARIIIITAKETSTTEAVEKGATEVIFKPFSSERILSAVDGYA